MYHLIKNADQQGYYTNSLENLHDIVLSITESEELAIDVSSWAEIACINERYETNEFVVCIEED